MRHSLFKLHRGVASPINACVSPTAFFRLNHVHVMHLYLRKVSVSVTINNLLAHLPQSLPVEISQHGSLQQTGRRGRPPTLRSVLPDEMDGAPTLYEHVVTGTLFAAHRAEQQSVGSGRKPPAPPVRLHYVDGCMGHCAKRHGVSFLTGQLKRTLRDVSRASFRVLVFGFGQHDQLALDLILQHATPGNRTMTATVFMALSRKV